MNASRIDLYFATTVYRFVGCVHALSVRKIRNWCFPDIVVRGFYGELLSK